MNILYASDENYLAPRRRIHGFPVRTYAAGGGAAIPPAFPWGYPAKGRSRLRDTLAPYGRELCLWELGDLRKWFDFSVNSGDLP